MLLSVQATLINWFIQLGLPLSAGGTRWPLEVLNNLGLFAEHGCTGGGAADVSASFTAAPPRFPSYWCHGTLLFV